MNRLHVTPGNEKIGEVYNLSFPPLITCRDDAPCKVECYANRLFLSRPSVRTAWGNNLELYRKDPGKFWSLLQELFDKKEPKRFRLFVGGDFDRELMVTEYITFTKNNPNTLFLAFTKRFEWLPSVKSLPDNLSILVSMWDNFIVTGNAAKYPKAWFKDAKHILFIDERIPTDAIVCTALCSDCGYKCFGIRDLGKDVVLKLHGSGTKKYSLYN